MLFKDDTLNLTIREMETALQRAGLPLDPGVWSSAQMDKIENVLLAAQFAKVARKIGRDAKRQLGTLANRN